MENINMKWNENKQSSLSSILTVMYLKDTSQVKSYNWRYQLILTLLTFSKLLELSKTYPKVIEDTNNTYSISIK